MRVSPRGVVTTTPDETAAWCNARWADRVDFPRRRRWDASKASPRCLLDTAHVLAGTIYSTTRQLFMSVYAVSMSLLRALASTAPSGLTFTCRIYLPLPSNRPAGSAQLAPTIKSDVDGRLEGVDVGEGGITYVRRRAAVMHQFAYVVSTVAHNVEPMSRDSSQLI